MAIEKSNWWLTEVCDRCPTARPQAVFILKTGGILYMCGHCARTHSDAIEAYLDTVCYAPRPAEIGSTGSSKGAP